jgi:hypothetical protein
VTDRNLGLVQLRLPENPVEAHVVNAEVDPIHEFANYVLATGNRVESRYGPTIEYIGGRLEVLSGVLVERPGINWTLGWVEVLQLLSGCYDLDSIKRVAPNANHDLFTYEMAYGPRIYFELSNLIRALQHDPMTRQAVLFVAKPEDGQTSNLPCTLTIQFLVRPHYSTRMGLIHIEDRINAIVSMRSWDLCLGLPYDLMMFSALLEMVGRCLTIPTGKIVVMAGSAHIYLDKKDKLPRMSNTRWRFSEDAPTNRFEFLDWASYELERIQKGETPKHIELY